ncbi:MAG: UDP-N-acetylglucosamine 1-carboxyvinyltransferase [Clostridia bacterium]|nr:UDP-N-acetylglucosamine 1-carboxyvinyltransferase [Clostridia bacterium]
MASVDLASGSAHTWSGCREILEIEGGNRLTGELAVQGAKNSVLPLLASSVLCRGETVLKHCPRLSDVDVCVKILRYLGCRCRKSGDILSVSTEDMRCCEIPHSLMRQMRSSIVFLGAVLARCGEARLSFPGGCALGPRPIDLHLCALKKLGAEICEEHGCLLCTAPRGLRGCHISLAFPSVGATENVLLAAVTAQGTTVLTNAACEPEIEDLALYLNRCGARISGAGESCIIIEGVPKLYGTEYTVMPDRIAAATYMAAAAVTHGTLLLRNINHAHLRAVYSSFEESGCVLNEYNGELLLRAPEKLKPVRHVRTMPYPGFPTDAQAAVMVMAAVGCGTSIFVENIFESRYKHVGELNRLGARIKVEGKVAVVEGVSQLSGAPVCAQELRGGAALAVAGLAAQGETQVFEPLYIDRGYERFEENLRTLGARIRRSGLKHANTGGSLN